MTTFERLMVSMLMIGCLFTMDKAAECKDARDASHLEQIEIIREVEERVRGVGIQIYEKWKHRVEAIRNRMTSVEAEMTDLTGDHQRPGDPIHFHLAPAIMAHQNLIPRELRISEVMDQCVANQCADHRDIQLSIISSHLGDNMKELLEFERSMGSTQTDSLHLLQIKTLIIDEDKGRSFVIRADRKWRDAFMRVRWHQGIGNNPPGDPKRALALFMLAQTKMPSKSRICGRLLPFIHQYFDRTKIKRIRGILLHYQDGREFPKLQRTDAVSGRAVFCRNLPTHAQRNEDLERRAEKIGNSYCEILYPSFDENDKVRLRWLGDDEVCGAVNMRYLFIVPTLYVHFIEDHDGSVDDDEGRQRYFEALFRGKLIKDSTQAVDGEATKNSHIAIKVPFEEYQRGVLADTIASMSHPTGIHPILERLIDSTLIPIAHRMHDDLEQVWAMQDNLEGIARELSPIQSWFPRQRPVLRIHLFPNERSHVRFSCALRDTIMDDKKQLTLVSAPDASTMMHLTYFPSKLHLQNSVHARLFRAHSRTLSDPQVFRDKHRLSRALQVLIRMCEPKAFSNGLETMSTLPGYKFQFREKIKSIRRLMTLIRDKDHRDHMSWREGEYDILNVEEKLESRHVWLKKWDDIVIAELGLRQRDKHQFWDWFGGALVQLWHTKPSDLQAIDVALAQDAIHLWRAVEFFLDPSYTVNIILFRGPDLDRMLVKETCLRLGFSWKALRPCIEWIDHDEDLVLVT